MSEKQSTICITNGRLRGYVTPDTYAKISAFQETEVTPEDVFAYRKSCLMEFDLHLDGGDWMRGIACAPVKGEGPQPYVWKSIQAMT